MSNARDDGDRLRHDKRGESRESRSVCSPAEEIALMHFFAGNFTTALEYLHQTLQATHAASHSDKFRILLRISDCHRRKGGYAEAERFLDAARTVVDDDNAADVAGRLEYREAYILHYRGNYDEALRRAFSAYRRLKDSSEHEEVAAIQTLIGTSYLRMGLVAEAEDFFSDALSSFRRVEDQVGIAHAYNNLGVLHKNACRWSRALASLHRSLDLAKTLGLTQHLITVQLNLGVVYGKTRKFPDAISVLLSAAESAERLGDLLKLTKALLSLGRAYVRTGDFARAEKTLLRAQTMSTELGYSRETALADEFLGELMMERGCWEEARVNLTRAYEGANRIAPEGDLVAECLARMAEVEYQLANPSRALELTADGLRIAANCEPYELGYLHRTRAMCMSRLGNLPQAIAEAEKSVGFFVDHENPFEKARSQQQLARFRARLGDEASMARARQELTESVREFGKLEESQDQVVSHMLLATIELRSGNLDDALLAVYEADRLVDEGRIEKLRHGLAALRRKIEARMTHATTRVVDQFSLLGDIQGGARSREHLLRGLESTLRLLMERLGTRSGFVAIPRPDGRSLVLAARDGMTARDAQAIANWYSRSLAEVPTRLSLVDATAPEAGEIRPSIGDGALVLQGLGFDDRSLGVLCVRQESAARTPFGQDALNFVSAYASLISLSIYELLRTEKRGQRRNKTQAAKGFENVVTDNTEMIQLLNLAERVAHADATVLLQGETGTGKGLIAYAIHLLSERREGRFVHVNCAALPEQLLESELFGHVRGAFTGAFGDKDGLLHQASGGTIFLDEIGKTSLAMQGKLLQFLDNSKVRRVGSNDFVTVDVRVVCASKTNLLKMCEDGSFLEDFFYRINDFPLTVPPLRDRREDIPLLMYHYVEKFTREMNKDVEGVSDEFLSRLLHYRWPGNVRELEKVVKRAVILADDGETLGLSHLAAEVAKSVAPADVVAAPTSEAAELSLRERIEHLEQIEIARVLGATEGNKSRAAIRLGISYPSLLSKIKRYNIQ